MKVTRFDRFIYESVEEDNRSFEELAADLGRSVQTIMAHYGVWYRYLEDRKIARRVADARKRGRPLAPVKGDRMLDGFAGDYGSSDLATANAAFLSALHKELRRSKPE